MKSVIFYENVNYHQIKVMGTWEFLCYSFYFSVYLKFFISKFKKKEKQSVRTELLTKVVLLSFYWEKHKFWNQLNVESNFVVALRRSLRLFRSVLFKMGVMNMTLGVCQEEGISQRRYRALLVLTQTLNHHLYSTSIIHLFFQPSIICP